MVVSHSTFFSSTLTHFGIRPPCIYLQVPRLNLISTMYLHPSLLIALSAWPTLSKAGFRIKPDKPDIPVSPPRDPYNHGPVSPGFSDPRRGPYGIPPQEELQTNMQSLEQRLEAVNLALDAGEEVVKAILAVVSTTITSVDVTCKSHPLPVHT